jgi:hypothetical protein
VGPQKHDALPKRHTMRRERDGAVIDGNTPADYPLLALCGSCHREIRIETYLGSGWEHIATPAPRTAGTITRNWNTEGT